MPVTLDVGHSRLTSIARIYALTAALLIAHEIDSAYWHEWEVFGIPGGIGAFAWLHVPLALAALWGLERLLAGARAGLFFSLTLATAGVGGGIIHSILLVKGRPEFRCAASVGLLGCMTISSTLLGALAISGIRGRRARPTSLPSSAPSKPLV